MNEKPNVLLITTDQQRFDTVLPRRPAWMRTPHLDHLQREGVNFTNAYADCPLCVASRMGILTGKHVRNHGTPGNGKTSHFIGSGNTLPTRMRELGYQTVIK